MADQPSLGRQRPGAARAPRWRSAARSALYQLRLAGVAYLDHLVRAGLLIQLPGRTYGVTHDLSSHAAATDGAWTPTTAKQDPVARLTFD